MAKILPGGDEGLGAMQSLERAMRVLRSVAAAGPGGARLGDVAEATQLSRSTAHRFLGALAQAGLLEQDDATASFHLGLELCSLGARAANRYELRDVAEPMMQRLVERTGDTIYLSLRSGHDAVCVERIEGEFPIKTLTLDVGDRRPLGIGAGSLALLAFQTDAVVEKAIAANAIALRAFPGFETGAVFEMVAETKRQGYAFNNERLVPGMSALGVPVFGKNQTAIAALSVAAITTRMGPDRRANIIGWLSEEAKILEGRLADITGGLTEQTIRMLARRRRGAA